MTFEMRLEKLQSSLEQADFILIGAGAGFSAAAGLTYSGKRFTDNFKPFIEKYGMTDMYSAGFYPFAKPEQKWAYWAKHIWHNRWQPESLPLYKALFERVKTKNYFVLTTNVDAQCKNDVGNACNTNVCEIQENRRGGECRNADNKHREYYRDCPSVLL